jgi:hypothetical protein
LGGKVGVVGYRISSLTIGKGRSKSRVQLVTSRIEYLSNSMIILKIIHFMASNPGPCPTDSMSFLKFLSQRIIESVSVMTDSRKISKQSREEIPFKSNPSM